MAWELDLNRIIHVFNVRPVAFTWAPLIILSQTELVMNTHVIVSEVRHDALKTWGEIDGQVHSVSTSCLDSSIIGCL